MKKFRVYVTYKETRVIEVEAEDEDAAIQATETSFDDLEPCGDDDYEYEVEEIEEDDSIT